MHSLTAPGFALEESDEGHVLRLSGDWTVATINQLDAQLRAVSGIVPDCLDVAGLGRLDTSGAYLIDRTWRQIGAAWPPQIVGEHASAASLLDQVHAHSEPAPPAPAPDTGLLSMLERTGKGSVDFYKETRASLAFLGETLVTIARLIANEVSDEWTIDEIDAHTLTPRTIDEIEARCAGRPLGGKGWAIIVNEAHGMNKTTCRRLLTLFDRLPSWATWIFTTTTEGQLVF